jgi:hypothetical protein
MRGLAVTFLRPDVVLAVSRLREVIAAALAGALGLWLIWLGGYLLIPLGAAILLLAAGWGLTAARRVMFARPVAAAGMVEVDEGQVGYLGPSFGGYVAMADLADLRLVEVAGQRQWRLKTADGQVLMIPVAASGAERLFDAFAVLPGIDMAVLARAMDGPAGTRALWQRGARTGRIGPAGDRSQHHDYS